MAKLLVVEDDQTLATMIQDWLKLETHNVDIINDGLKAMSKLQHGDYELAILDWEVPGLSGVELCRQIRLQGLSIPVLMLTAKKSLPDKRNGLDAGADDYLTKPFDMDELGARVRALLRRFPRIRPTVLRVADIELDTNNSLITKNGEEIHFPPKEFALLEFFLRYPNQVFSAEALIDRVWPTDSESSPEAVRPYINRIRAKIDVPGSKKSLIETVHGLGYKLLADP